MAPPFETDLRSDLIPSRIILHGTSRISLNERFKPNNTRVKTDPDQNAVQQCICVIGDSASAEMEKHPNVINALRLNEKQLPRQRYRPTNRLAPKRFYNGGYKSWRFPRSSYYNRGASRFVNRRHDDRFVTRRYNDRFRRNFFQRSDSTMPPRFSRQDMFYRRSNGCDRYSFHNNGYQHRGYQGNGNYRRRGYGFHGNGYYRRCGYGDNGGCFEYRQNGRVGGRSPKKEKILSKDQLDKELDAYMARANASQDVFKVEVEEDDDDDDVIIIDEC